MTGSWDSRNDEPDEIMAAFVPRMVPKLPDWRWLKAKEPVPAGACWYDSHPSGTGMNLEATADANIYEAALTTLLYLHDERGKDWPSDCHGLCGIVVRR